MTDDIIELLHSEGSIVCSTAATHITLQQARIEELEAKLEKMAVSQGNMRRNHWHYQLMYHKVDMKSFVDGGYYAIHEYYPTEDGDGWTEQPITVDGESVEEVKWVLQMMLQDIEKYGVKDYE